jgi:hypothetical protein
MELSEFIESVGEWESESESAEAARGRGAPRRPSSTPSFKPRPAPSNTLQYVTQTQLEAALARSDAKVKTVADGVSTIHARVHAVSAATRKEADERKKAFDSQNKDLNQKLQLMAMLPVLITPKTKTVLDADGVTHDEVVVPDDSSLNKLLPLLLVTGMGGMGGISGSSDSSGDGGNSMMMMALVLALAK